MNQIYLQLGSNLGARENFLQTARDFISEELGLIEKISKIYESTPWGVDGQGCFLNQVLLSAYPIMQDDARLRAWNQSGQAMATYFDRMRKNYPIRREYSYFIFPEVAQLSPVFDWLNVLGSRTLLTNSR